MALAYQGFAKRTRKAGKKVRIARNPTPWYTIPNTNPHTPFIMSQTHAHKHSPITYVVMGFLVATVLFGLLPIVGPRLWPVYPRSVFYLNSNDEDYDGIPPFDDAMFNFENVDRRWECVLKAVKNAGNGSKASVAR